MLDSDGSEVIRCGFCSHRDAGLKDPKILPGCSHIHCFTCLRSLLNSCGFLRCPHPTCREYCDVGLVDLSSSTSSRHTSFCCKCSEPAEIFCSKCRKKYCKEHEEMNGEFCGEKSIPIAEYDQKSARLETRRCPKHSDKRVNQIIYATKDGQSLFCTDCFIDFKETSELFKIEDRITEFTDELNNLNARLNRKQTDLKELYEQTKQSLENHERCTDAMKKALEETMNEQIDMIKENYRMLEEQLDRERTESKEKLKSFLDGTVRDCLFEVHLERERIRSHLDYNHEVDVVKDHGAVKSHAQGVCNKAMPELTFRDLELEYLEKSRRLEMKDKPREVTVGLHKPYDSKFLTPESEDDDSDSEFEDAETDL